MQHSFSKKEKLKSRKIISLLFSEGRSLFKYPVKLVYLPLEKGTLHFPLQATVSVSKKKFTAAASRNRIKRLLREAYRLHKYDLLEHVKASDREMALMLIYIADREVPWKKLDHTIKNLLLQLAEKIN